MAHFNGGWRERPFPGQQPFLTRSSPFSSLLRPQVLWAGTWFLGFCFLANQWHHSPPKQFLLGNSSAKASIAFAFFSVPIWVRMSHPLDTLCRRGGGLAHPPTHSGPAPPQGLLPWLPGTSERGRPALGLLWVTAELGEE